MGFRRGRGADPLLHEKIDSGPSADRQGRRLAEQVPLSEIDVDIEEDESGYGGDDRVAERNQDVTKKKYACRLKLRVRPM